MVVNRDKTISKHMDRTVFPPLCSLNEMKGNHLEEFRGEMYLVETLTSEAFDKAACASFFFII